MFEQAQPQHLIGSKPEIAIDAAGLESRHASAHYGDREGWRRFKRKTWPSLRRSITQSSI
jgi:hypothetical protein